MEGKPFRQQHDLDRHHRYRPPRNETEQRQHDAGEHVGALRAATGAHRLARAAHVLRVDGIADHLEGEIGLDRRAHVEIAVLEQRPAAVSALDAAQIDRDLRFERRVDRLAEIVPQQHILGRNGGIGLELEHPMAIGPLAGEQSLRRRLDAWFEGILDAAGMFALQGMRCRCPHALLFESVIDHGCFAMRSAA